MEMGLMALKTEERLILFKQAVGYRSVGIMTDSTVLENRGMFENERSLLIPMTVEAEIVEPFGRF
jgi:hypothetical protein